MVQKEKEMTIQGLLEEWMPEMPEVQRKKQVEAIHQMMTSGIPLKDSLKIAPDVIEFLYSQGVKLYMIGKYAEALKFFYMLYLLEGKNPRYSMGLAACYHMLKDFDQAMVWYLILSMIDRENPMAYYYLSDCELKQGDKKGCLFFLHKTLDRIGENPVYSQLKERILRMTPLLDQEIDLEEIESSKGKVTQGHRGGNSI